MLQVYKTEVEENNMKLTNQLEKLIHVKNELKEKNFKLIAQRKEIDRLVKSYK